MKNGNHIVAVTDMQEAVGLRLLTLDTAGEPVIGGVITQMEKNGSVVDGEEDS
jgi:hypothetical protein